MGVQLLFLGGLAAFLLGLMAGFVANVVATRLAAGRPFLGPFYCTRSHHPLSLSQIVPIAGYLLQQGRCRGCGAALSLAYPATELITAALFLAFYLVDDFGLRFLLHAAYTLFLLIVLVVDWKHKEIYFSIIVIGSLIAIAGSFLLPEVGFVSALIGAAVAGGFFLLAYGLAKLIFPRIEEPLGAGDVLLALMMGLMLGFPNIVGALLIGPLLAGAAALILLVTRRSKLGDFIPYGVALCAATILLLLYPAPFVEALNLSALQQVVSGIFPGP